MNRKFMAAVLSIGVLAAALSAGCGKSTTGTDAGAKIADTSVQNNAAGQTDTTDQSTAGDQSGAASAQDSTGNQTDTTDQGTASNQTQTTVIAFLGNTITVPGYGGSDTKFYKDKIITSKDGVPCLLDLSGNVLKTYDGAATSWLYALDNSNCILYGNVQNQTGILWLDDNDDLAENQIIFQSENLQIDPTLIQTENGYLMTVTEIIGTVNSAVEGDNGEYILHLYSSSDLRNWTPVTDIVDEMHNIEDVDLIEKDGCLYVIYEQEVLDKGDSAIYVKTSSDGGVTWGEPTELLPADSDHEPAAFVPCSDGFVLYYSSDQENPGTTYEGAKAYYARYDSSLNCLEKDIHIDTEKSDGLLWYDVAEINGQTMTLMAGNYLTDVSLLISQAE